MKTFLRLLVLLFSFPLAAEDISDFKIEGMGVNDNIRDYFSENQLDKFYISYGIQHSGIEFNTNQFNLQTYDAMQVHYDKKSNKIIGIFGAIEFPDDISGCLN